MIFKAALPLFLRPCGLVSDATAAREGDDHVVIRPLVNMLARNAVGALPAVLVL